jgi:glycosyltransferase involved in cell wall biosynthesis
LRHLCPDMEPHFGLCFPGRLREELVVTGVPVYDLGTVRVSRPWTLLRARWRLKRVLQANKCDAVVVHSSWPHAVFAPVVRAAKVRLVHAVHGEVNPRHWSNRWAARTAPDLVLANSRFTAATIPHIFRHSATGVVYPPLAEPAAFDRSATRERIRAEFGASNDAVVVLIVSRIEVIKGHEVLLDSLGRLRALPGWVCWIVGGTQRPHEEQLLTRLKAGAARFGVTDRVRFVGPRRDVPQIMGAADIYCQPNTGPEGFGLTFIEALRAGLPVVSSAFGGAAEIVNATCGVLCPPGNADAVAATLRDLIVAPDRRRQFGSCGPARAAELCDPARQIAAWASAIGVEVCQCSLV